MRNYEEHISTPITTIESNINGYVKLFANIYSIRKELKETGWKKLLDTQFVNEEMIEINSYINESNNIDILFIKEILFSKRLHINNIEYRVGDIIMDNDIKYRCIFKKKDILSNKIIDQCFVPMCLDNKDIKYILDNV